MRTRELTIEHPAEAMSNSNSTKYIDAKFGFETGKS